MDFDERDIEWNFIYNKAVQVIQFEMDKNFPKKGLMGLKPELVIGVILQTIRFLIIESDETKN